MSLSVGLLSRAILFMLCSRISGVIFDLTCACLKIGRFERVMLSIGLVCLSLYASWQIGGLLCPKL